VRAAAAAALLASLSAGPSRADGGAPPPPAEYSLWIAPSGAARDGLEKQIAALSLEQRAPRFPPHVTLLGLGAAGGGEEALAAKSAELAKSLRPFKVRLGKIGYEDDYFRCLYRRVEDSPELTAANAKARRSFGREGDPPFRPHLSLLYGKKSEAEKRKIAAGLGRAGEGLRFKVASLQLWITTGMPENWRLVREFPLGR
jgi:2'-5' RNA ligase